MSGQQPPQQRCLAWRRCHFTRFEEGHRDGLGKCTIAAIARAGDGDRGAAQFDLRDAPFVTRSARGNLHLTRGKQGGFMQRPEKPLAVEQTAVLRDAHDQIEPDRPVREQRVDVALPVGHHGHGRSLAKPLRRCRTAGKPACRFLLLEGTITAGLALARAPRPDRRVNQPDHRLSLDIDGDHRMDEEARGFAVTRRPKATALLVATGKIDLAGVLDRQDAVPTALRHSASRAGGHNVLGRHIGRGQEAVHRHLTASRLANPPQHNSAERYHPINQPVCPFRYPDVPECHQSLRHNLPRTLNHSQDAHGITSVNPVAPRGEGKAEYAAPAVA